MINGVLLIIAAVLFAVVYLFGDMGILWLWIAGFYLIAGIADLVIHVIREKARLRSANKEAQKSAKAAEEARKEAESARKAEAAVGPVLPEKEKENG